MSNENNVFDLSTIQTMLGQTAFSLQTISEQMGIVTTQVKELKVNQLRQGEKIEALNERLEKHESRDVVDVNEVNIIKKAIHKRACDLLGIYYNDGIVADECLRDDVKYRGKFIQKLYCDARKEGRLGTPVYATYQRDYLEVLEYINNWVPLVGVEGYKAYLDEREALRKK